MKYIRFHNEQIDDPLQRLKNKKSNLILNLETSGDQKPFLYTRIANYEIEIAKAEIERGHIKKALRNLKSSQEYLRKIKFQFMAHQMGEIFRKTWKKEVE